MSKQLTPADLRTSNASGYRYVLRAGGEGNGHGGGKPWAAMVNVGGSARGSGGAAANPDRPVFRGPRRATALEAAQDYCDYVNGNPGVLDHTPSTGRPDFYMDANGTLHRDLPPETIIRKALKKRVIDTPERKLMLDMTPRLREVMQPGDLVEAKAGVSRAQIMTAVSQLKLGRFEKGIKGRNFLLVPERPSELHVKWVESEGIILVTPTKETA